MIKTYLFLAGAVFFEVAGTMLLPVTQNFTKLVPTAALAFFYLCAFYLLTFVTDKIPIAIYVCNMEWFRNIYYCHSWAMYFLNKR